MSVGPLRRLTGAVGLVALVPIAWLLATNAITLPDAALRATVTLVVVMAVGRLVGWFVSELAGSFEREDTEAPGSGPSGQPGKSDEAVDGAQESTVGQAAQGA